MEGRKAGREGRGEESSLPAPKSEPSSSRSRRRRGKRKGRRKGGRERVWKDVTASFSLMSVTTPTATIITTTSSSSSSNGRDYSLMRRWRRRRGMESTVGGGRLREIKKSVFLAQSAGRIDRKEGRRERERKGREERKVSTPPWDCCLSSLPPFLPHSLPKSLPH